MMQAWGRSRASLDATGRTSDARLVARARRGDAVAFDELVARHLRSAYAVALSEVLVPEAATAACQDAFLRALDELDRCTYPAQFLPWLLQITRQCAADARKRGFTSAAAQNGSGALRTT